MKIHECTVVDEKNNKEKECNLFSSCIVIHWDARVVGYEEGLSWWLGATVHVVLSSVWRGGDWDVPDRPRFCGLLYDPEVSRVCFTSSAESVKIVKWSHSFLNGPVTVLDVIRLIVSVREEYGDCCRFCLVNTQSFKIFVERVSLN